jgi:hypothetical protein
MAWMGRVFQRLQESLRRGDWEVSNGMEGEGRKYEEGREGLHGVEAVWVEALWGTA